MHPIETSGYSKPSHSVGRFKGRLLASAMALLAAGSLVASASAAPAAHPALAANTPQSVQTPALSPGMPPSFATLVERVSPSVVTIEVDREEPAQLSALDNFDFFQGQLGRNPSARNGRAQQAPMTRSRVAGSGFIIDSSGYIVTNNHVIESGKKIMVHLADKRIFEAKLVGTDPDTDVALLKIDAKGLPVVAFGDDRRLRVGDWVVAVGNPFGLGGTVTAGIVSSMGRDIGGGPYTDYIQIDAPINSGNSGGPTFDVSGRVVGMNTAIYSPSGGSVGIGFAIPASTIHTVVDQLRSQGHIDRGFLGVQIQSLTPDIASSLGLHDEKGALVANVTANSPASRAGFRQGDVIVDLNGMHISDSRDLSRDVGGLHAGDKANFTVLRDGAKQALVATIQKREPEKVASATNAPRGESSLGLTLMPINPGIREQYELGDKVSGVVVTSVDPMSEAADKGLHPGDVVTRVNGQAVQLPSDISRNVAEAKKLGRDNVLLLVAGQGGEHFVALKIA